MAKKPVLTPRLPYTVDSLLAGGSGTVTNVLPLDPRELLSAMEHLFDEFGVPRGNWEVLAMHLALRGGFVQIRRPTGQIPFWNPERFTALWLEVGLWQRSRDITTVDACLRDPAFLTHWGQRSSHSEQASSLTTRYYDAPKKSAYVAAFQKFLDQADPSQAEQFWRSAAQDGLAGAMHDAAATRRSNEEWLRRFPTALK